MRLLRPFVRSGRALAGIALLAALVVGEVADARHHLAESGCASDASGPGRDDNCTCAGLHSATPAGLAPAAFTPVEREHGWAPGAVPVATRRLREAEASPRAPPRS